MTLEITYRDGRTELRPVTKVRYSFVDGIQNICYEYEKDNAGETRLTIDDISQIRITPETSKYTSIKLGGRSPFEKWERFNKIVNDNEDEYSIYCRSSGLPHDPLAPQVYTLVVKHKQERKAVMLRYFSEPNDEILAEDALWLLQRAHELKQGEVQEFYFMGGGDCTKCKEEEHNGRNDTCERDARGDKEDK